MTQSSLPFGTDAKPENRSLLEVLGQSKADENRASGSKTQKRFRQLVTKIEQQRRELQHWQDYVLRYNQRITAELEPLRHQFVEQQRGMALLIDELLTRPASGRPLGRKYRERLRELLDMLLEDALAAQDDECLAALREKYRDPETEEDRRLAMNVTRDLLGVLGVELADDHGARSAEELMEYAHRQMHEQFEQAREAEMQRRARREERARSRPKSAKAQAAAVKREQAARAVGQSLREVFRKLASALHPDRERDPEERRRKNELMQEVNRAYEAGDLLTLLDLQLRIEQIDTAHLSSLAPERLAHYNQILREQLADLEAELARVTEPFRMLVPPGGRLNRVQVDRQIDAEKALLRQTIKQLQDDMAAFRDPTQLRRKLDECAAPDDFSFDEIDIFDDPDVFDEIAGLMHGAQTPRRPRKRKRARK